MRNLKRALSLSLAAAMLIGMMVVGASAEYKDQASVTNTEAVDLLSALGVIGGDQNGNYNPAATLTRAEFCVCLLYTSYHQGKGDGERFRPVRDEHDLHPETVQHHIHQRIFTA